MVHLQKSPDGNPEENDQLGKSDETHGGIVVSFYPKLDFVTDILEESRWGSRLTRLSRRGRPGCQ